MLDTLTYEVLYSGRKEANIAAAILAFEALNYSRLYPAEAIDDIEEIYAFNAFAQNLIIGSFVQLKHSCKGSNGAASYRIELSALIDGAWQSASYNCKVLPPKKYTFN